MNLRAGIGVPLLGSSENGDLGPTGRQGVGVSLLISRASQVPESLYLEGLEPWVGLSEERSVSGRELNPGIQESVKGLCVVEFQHSTG